MLILDVYIPDLNMFNAKTPNFVNYMNGVTTYAIGLNAASKVWENRSTPKFKYYDWAGSHSIQPVNPGDTIGMHDAFKKHTDSILKAHGGRIY